MTPFGPYAELRLFLRVVELGTIRAAARELGLEPSSISRRLSGLEARLGTKLLERARAHTRPTEAGRRYYERLRALMAEIDALEADVAGEAERPRGLLRVNSTIDFGQLYLAGWLLDFKALHPGLDVELTLAAQRIDLVAAGVDVAIRVGAQPDSALKSRTLARAERVLVAAPAYLARRGVPTAPADLTDHDHIFFLSENRHQPLRLTGPDGTRHEIPRRGGVTINAVMSLVDAAKRGFGLHMGPRWALADALDRGEVVEVLPDYRHEPMPMMAVWAPAVFLPARIRAFVDFIADRVRALPGMEA
jgi:DNA-binding transcriptional LysR family regulator